MEVSQSRPKMSADTEPADSRYPQLCRRYGQVGYDRFDNVLSQYASVGTASIGKVTVDCKFLFKKSLWGVLSDEKNPAGIIYLDLSFHQPADHRLKAATVTVTLDEDHEDLPRPSYRYARQMPVQIGPYGPTQLNGQARRTLKTSRSSMKPEMEFGGFAGIGGVGFESETQYEDECRWTFSSQVRPDPKSKKAPSAYKVLEWQLTENELESKSFHSSTVHTAFSFEHDGQPFLMHVNVKGDLRSRRSNARQKMRKLKFGSSSKDTPEATTYIDFGGRHRFSRRLDELAKGLPFAMERENMKSIPVEISNSHVATFREAPAEDHVSQTSDSLKYSRDDDGILSSSSHESLGNGVLAQTTETESHSLDWEADQGPVTNNPCLPTTKNLADVLLSLKESRKTQRRNANSYSSGSNEKSRRTRRGRYIGVHPHSRESRQDHSEASSATIVDAESVATEMAATPGKISDNVQSEQLALSLLRLTGLMKIMQLCMIFLSSWGVDISPQEPAARKRIKQIGNGHTVSTR